MTDVSQPRLAGLARIRAFIADYHADDGNRALTPIERQLVEDALIEFMLGEDWRIGSLAGQVASARTALAALARNLPAPAQPTIPLIEQCVVDLASRLERCEDSNLIMREHLVMLSETNRQLTERLAVLSNLGAAEKRP